MALEQREAVGRPSFQRHRRPLPSWATGRGLYSSLLTDWRRQRDAGAYEALKVVKRGPKPAASNPLAVEHAQLLRENGRLTLRLQRAEAIIDIQKKVALLLGLSMPSDEAS